MIIHIEGVTVAMHAMELLDKPRIRRKHKLQTCMHTESLWTHIIHQKLTDFSKPGLSNTLMQRVAPPKKVLQKASVWAHVSADMLRCVISVCEREGERQIKERQGEGREGTRTDRERERERKREWKIKTEKRVSSGKKGEKRKKREQKASESCMCVGSQPCQGPVSLWFMAPRLGAVFAASSVLLQLTANEAGRAFKHST